MRVSKAFNSLQGMIALNWRLVPGSAASANTVHIALFSGTPPTDDQLQAMLSTTNTMFTWSAAALSSFATQSNFLGDATLSSFVPNMDYDNNIINLPFSSQPNTMTIATSGTPTWFLMRVTSVASAGDSWTNFVAGTNCYALMTGTVGDENSTADLRILGGTVTAGQPVRVADMRIKL
ncbi:hypothetical protein pEaSNUABM3_00081 [Erwinia phage pEa_SNUABM_3]|uniref:Uncharacterized protein n=1 Tax=Erwinia phage pEa_SNUABM_3 TaxID=2869552 RepID=A0AAE8C2R0_9CAUD|nr:hypothetical protein MPK68_gp081 [Erwinia phage pEa_SNUABM_3]QZE56278.1 hypothetical protein pEaSNUABM3_00081 [Erwinia phage pEa_SNUABM_3]